MILTDVDETRSRMLALVGKVSDARTMSDAYADGYVDCLRSHMRQSPRWRVLRPFGTGYFRSSRRVSRADRAAISRRLGRVAASPSRVTL